MTHQVAFVDSRVVDAEVLLARLAADTSIYWLDPERDGIRQITEALGGLADINSVHVISHGSAGCLLLGSTALTEAALSAYGESFGVWRSSLVHGADILLYGCDVAAGSNGASFLSALAGWTGADVAASVDITGSVSLGGDWSFEIATGPVESLIIDGADYPNILGVINGDEFDNKLDGTPLADLISGLGGNDTLDGKDGDDTLDGADGNDRLLGGYGDDVLLGGDGDDTLNGGDGDDTLNGGDGDDSISDYQQGDVDIIDGGSGLDRLFIDLSESTVGVHFAIEDNLSGIAMLADGTQISNIEWVWLSGSDSALYGDSLTGGQFDDSLAGNGGDDTLVGADGNDYLAGGHDDDVLLGGNGDDIFEVKFEAGHGADSIDGGAGIDTVYIVATHSDIGLDFTLAANSNDTVVVSAGISFTNVERLHAFGSDNASDSISGGTSNDTLFGGDDDDTLMGGAGNDWLYGGAGDTWGEAGNDFLDGGKGNDRLSGDGGDDTLIGGSGNDTLSGSTVDEFFSEDMRSVQLDSFDGGAGIDYAFIEGDYSITSINFTLADNLVGVVTLSNGTTVTNIERVRISGSLTASDSLVGGDLDDVLYGGGGDDTLVGGDGNDTLSGGEGIDSMAGGDGGDTYIVTEGDVIIEIAGAGADTVHSDITWRMAANLEQLVLNGSAVKGTGNSLDNLVMGSDVRNILVGNAGNDELSSAGGNDLLVGGSGDDSLSGGAGNDHLRGGTGNDQLTGGAGRDHFSFDQSLSDVANVDTITDFTHLSDKLRLDDDIFSAFDSTVSSRLLATQLVKGDHITSAQDADDRIIYDTSTGALYYDADGVGGSAAVQFAVLGITTHLTLSTGDFAIVG